MKAAIAFALMSLVAAADKTDVPTTHDIAQNQLTIWLPIIFIFLALLTASKIDADNQPNKKQDSILFARFLTNPPNKEKAM